MWLFSFNFQFSKVYFKVISADTCDSDTYSATPLNIQHGKFQTIKDGICVFRFGYHNWFTIKIFLQGVWFCSILYFHYSKMFFSHSFRTLWKQLWQIVIFTVNSKIIAMILIYYDILKLIYFFVLWILKRLVKSFKV